MSEILHGNSISRNVDTVYELIDDPIRKSEYTHEDWVRPSDWIYIPTPNIGDEVINILFAVYPDGPNFLNISASGTFSVDWGDGTTQSVSSGSYARKEFNWSSFSSNTTTSEGFRQSYVKIKPLFPGTLTSVDFQNYHSYNSKYNEVNILEIKMSAPKLTSLILNNDTNNFNQFVKLRNFEFVGTHSISDMNRTFNGCVDLQRVRIDLSGVTNASYMFGSCTNLIDFKIINTNSVVDMSYMFQYCYSLNCAHYIRDFVIDASSCTDMRHMFRNCHSLVETPTILNSSKVTNMSYMFYECNNLNRVLAFSASSVTDMSYMFQNCHVLRNLPLLDTPKLIDMSYMFSNCSQLNSIPKFDTSNVTSMYYTFENCGNLVSDVGDNFEKGFPLLNTSKVTDMRGTFYGTGRIKTLPLLDTSSVTRMYRMFYGSSISEVPLFNTSNVWEMSYMFQYCSNLVKIPLFNTQNVTTMEGMFYNCIYLKTIPLFNTQNVTTMYRMFRCDQHGSLIGIPKLNTSKVTDMSEMFYNQRFFINYPELNISKVTDLNYMFYSCWSLKEVGNFSSTFSSTMYSMFYGCNNLRKIGYINLPICWDMRQSFQWCSRLEYIAGITASPYYLHYTFQGCGKLKEIPYFNTSGAVGDDTLHETFMYCSSLITIPNFDFSNVKSFYRTFRDCTSLKYIPNINTKSSKRFEETFYNCHHLEEVPVFDVSGYNRTAGITMDNMFYNCYNLKSVTFSNATASNFSCQNTFYSCIRLEKVSLPNFTVGSPGGMFYNCHNLLDIGTFSFEATGWDNWGGYTNTFRNCYKLNNITDLVFKGRSADFGSMFNNCISLTETPYFDMSNGGWVGVWQNNRQDYMFSGCENLMKINATGSRYKINLNRTNLNFKNISNFLDGILPYDTRLDVNNSIDRGTNNTINLYDNPGLPEMISIHKRKIVFEKGYTFSYANTDNSEFSRYPWQYLGIYIQVNDDKSYMSGPTISNISGYKYPDTTFLNGTLINSPIYNLNVVNYDDYVANSYDDLLPTGKNSNLEFNGVDQCITFGTQSTILSSGTIFTVFELTESPPINGTWSIMGRYGSTSSNYFLDFTGGRLRFGFTQMGTSTIRHRTLNATFSVGVKYSIFAKYYHWGSHVCDIWINDVLQTTSNNYSENISNFSGELRMAEDSKNVLSIAGDYYNNRSYSKIKVYAAGLYYKLIDDWEVNELNNLFKRIYVL